MSSTIMPAQQIPPITVINMSKQGQKQDSPVSVSLITSSYPDEDRTVKTMQSPASKGTSWFLNSSVIFVLANAAFIAANKEKYLIPGRIMWPVSVLIGIGAGLLQHTKIDTAKANQKANEDIIIRNIFTGNKTALRKDLPGQHSAPINLPPRELESPLSHGVKGIGFGLGIGLIQNFAAKILGREKHAWSGGFILGFAAMGGAIWAIMQKIRVDGAKSNKDVNQDIIIENSLTGDKEIIKRRKQGQS